MTATLAGRTTRGALLDDWSWDLPAIDGDLEALEAVGGPPATPATATRKVRGELATTEEENDEDTELLWAVLAAAEPARVGLAAARTQLQTTTAMARVAQWHLCRFRRQVGDRDGSGADGANGQDEEDLRAMAGSDWQARDDPLAVAQALANVDEMSALLQRALAACEDDVEPFQQALEQLFAAFLGQQLVIPTTWIRPAATAHATGHVQGLVDDYANCIIGLCDPDTANQLATPELSEAERHQDAKDIQRDELVVNGERILGAVGYDEIVATISAKIEQILEPWTIATEEGVGASPRDEIVARVAQQILHACNRTESGGCSYEVLSRFISDHAMDRVIIRPDSGKAPPLEVVMDLGVYHSAVHCGWSFGLRVRVSAVTWYSVCDASDPTCAYHEIQTTYTNRLAFPLGLTPFSLRSSMRRDEGIVAIRLVTSTDEAPVDKGPEDIDYDLLM